MSYIYHSTLSAGALGIQYIHSLTSNLHYHFITLSGMCAHVDQTEVLAIEVLTTTILYSEFSMGRARD